MANLNVNLRSGEIYKFAIYSKHAQFPDQAGVYLFTEELQNGKHRIIYAGETGSFRDRPLSDRHEKWQCAENEGFTHISIHPIQNRVWLQDQIISKHNPPCNG